MTATATERQHQPWCNDHADPDPTQPDDTGSCSWQRDLGSSHFVNVEEGENGAAPYVAAWGNGEAMTPQQAREMAAATIRASVFADGLSEASASVARVVAERQPMYVNDVELLARLLGVSLTEPFTD